MQRQNIPSTSTSRPPTSTHIIFKYSIEGLTVSYFSSLWSILFSQSVKGLAAQPTWPGSQRLPTWGLPSKWGRSPQAENKGWSRKSPSFSPGDGLVPNSRLGEGKESAEVRTERKKVEICPSRLMSTKHKSCVFFSFRKGSWSLSLYFRMSSFSCHL